MFQVLQNVLIFQHRHNEHSQLKTPTITLTPLVTTPIKDKIKNKENSELRGKVEEGSKVEI